MAEIDIQQGSSPFITQSFTASSGDVFNIPANLVGNIFIDGAADFTVNIEGSLTGRGTDNLSNITFGEGTDVTVNIPAGVDTSPYAIFTFGQNLTLNIDDGATVGEINASEMDSTSTFAVNAGDNVTVAGNVLNRGPADASINFGLNANITGQVQGSAGGSADITFGNGATFGGSLTGATGSNPDQTSTITLGDNVSINGQLVSNHLYGDRTVEIGDNLTLNNALDLTGGTPFSGSPSGANLTIGDNATVLGNITGTADADSFVIGDNWDLRNINMLLGNDTVNIGTQSPDAVVATGIDGGNPNGDGSDYGSDLDLISIRLRPDQISDFESWGWVDNGDGTWSPPGPSFNGSPANSGVLRINDFEGAADPVPADPTPNGIVDGETTGELMTPEYDDAGQTTDGGGDIIDGADGDDDIIEGNGGDDTITAGAGDDLIDGGADDDIIYGDSADSASAGGAGVPGTTLGDGPGSTGKNFDRVRGESEFDTFDFTTDAFYLGNDIPFLDGPDFRAINGETFSQTGTGGDRTFTMDELALTGGSQSFVGVITIDRSDLFGANTSVSSSLTGPQDLVSVNNGTADFRMNDGQVFPGIRITYIRDEDGNTFLVPGDSPTPGAFNSFRNLLATNDSGIESFTIATTSDTTNGILVIGGDWADGQFFENSDGDGGDDTIIGGTGADQMFGEGGDDTFIVGSAAEGAGDVISGGNGPDETTDNDVLDLRGAGTVTINDAADANDAGATAGTVTFADGSTLEFEGIETILEGPAGPGPNGIVDGEDFAEDMGIGYNDAGQTTDGGGDIIDGADGDDDTIQGNGGDDTITAGAGDDTVDGGTDDDLIYGDFGEAAEPVPGNPTTLDISDLSGGRIVSEDGAVTTDVSLGGFIQTTSSSTFGKVTPDNVFYSGPEVGGSRNTLDLDFDTPVSDVSFTIFDVNQGRGWDDQVGIIALDADGNQLPVTFSGTNVSNGGVDVRGNTIDGNDDNTTRRLDANNPDNVQVQIEGPISSLQVIHEPGNDTSSVIGWIGVGDIDVTPLVDPNAGNPSSADDGDDVIDGGTGEDTIFGEGGNDTIDGGADDDLIYGDSGVASNPTGPSTEVDVPSEGGVATLLVWDVSQLTYSGGDPFPNSTSGLNDSSVNGITMTIGNEQTPVAVGIDDSPNSEFDDGDLSQDTTNNAFIDGTNISANSTIIPEYSYNVRNVDTGEIIEVYAVEVGSNNVIGFVSNARMEQGATYEFFDRTDTTPSVAYGDLATTYIDPDGGVVAPADGGDDTIIGGIGADTMFGEGGDDTFIVGSAAEGAGDVISGGNGPDETTDNDVLDLRGAGPVTINATADANDAGAQSGSVTFADAATLTFEGIEEILTDDDSANPDYQPTSTDNLVSLWEFSENDSNTALDTAGVTSNGTMQGDAFMANGELQLDGDGDYMLVQPDPEHQLSAGRIELVFNQDAHEGSSLDTLVSRDSGGRDDGGNFTMAVTEDGAVTVRHQTESDDVDFSTPDNFFSLGDDVRVSYSWDEGGDGGTFLVENITNGATYEAAVPNTLTMDMGPDFNEPWTVGASQAVSGDNTADNLREFFDGEISYVAIYDGNTAPTANDDVTNTAEGTAVQVNVLANDTDPEGGDLDIQGTPTAANGTVEVDNETGDITYTPNPGFVGADTIAYTTVDEGGLTDTATLTVNVASAPDSGPDAIDDSITVFESEGAGDTDGNVLTNDLQDAGEQGPYTGGVVEVNGATGSVGEWIDLPEGGRVLINSDGSVDFDANGDFEGLSDGESENVTIDYSIQTTSAASTGANPGEGPTINVGTTLTSLVTVGGAGAETFAVGGDGDLIGGTAIAVTGNLLPPLLFGNDNDTLDISDAVAQGWTPTELIRLPDQPLIGNGYSGSFLLTKDGEFPVTVTYLEIENFVGFDNVTEKDAATLTVTVQGEDDAPVTQDDTATTDEDTPVTIDPLANDVDPDGQPLEILGTPTSPDGTVTVNPDGTIEFTPDPDFNGPTTIDYIAVDPDGNETPGQITVDVAPVNDAPDAVDDRAVTDFETPVTIDVLDNDTDAENDPVTITAATVPVAQGTVAIVGDELVFTPADGFEGVATITYTVSDGVLTGTADVVVTVGDNPADGVVDGAEDGEVMDPGYVDPQGDEIDGADGLDDTIEGNGGDDDIDAGLGDDDVSGGTGDDTIDGNVGNDTLAGNEGEDSIDGGDGDDVIDGGDDDDEIIGGDGSDSVLGGAGDDVIDTSGPFDAGAGIGLPDSGYPGVFPGDTDPDNDKDTVDGGDGNDVISTGDDADVITGGTGSDTIDGGIDNDTIDGGEDGDRIVGGEGADDILGGGGDDTIYAGNDPDLGLDIYNLEDDGTNPLGDDLNEDNGRDTVSGGAGNDLIFGADDDDLLMGDAGNDTIDGGIDDDTIMGGTGDDSLLGGQGNDSIEGGAGDDLIDGGIGNDSLLGGDDRDTFVNVNANDTVDGGEGGDDFDTLDLTGSTPAGGGLRVQFDPANNENGVVNYFDSDGNAAGTLEFSNIENVIPCFTPGTLIATAKGERLVEELQPGDRVITRDNGFQEIAWVGAKQMSGRALAQRPNLKPVFVKAGALGDGLPERDMVLSPNHRVLLASNTAELYFEEREVLVAAKHLIGKPGIQQVDVAQTTYIHFMFESHEVVLSDGTWTESFHPGDYSINGIDTEARDEILALFPDLATNTGMKNYRLARTELKKHEAQILIG